MIYFVPLSAGLDLAGCRPCCVNRPPVYQLLALDAPALFVKVVYWDTPAIREALPC